MTANATSRDPETSAETTPEEIERHVNEMFIAPMLLASTVRAEEHLALPTMNDLDWGIRGDSSFWSSRFLLAGVNPHEVKPPPEVSVYFKWKLVRYEYTAAALPIVVIETHRFTLVKVGHPAIERMLHLDRADQVREVARIGASLLNVASSWKPRKPSSADELIAFSTNPGVQVPTMGMWSERVDAGVYRNELYFLLYKRRSQMIGFPANENWFRAEFRTKYEKAK